jgi:molecular chaperone DnaJ
MSGQRDLYLILDVGRSASESDIRRAFRKLARRYHPDINPGDRTAEERFKMISEAYEILSDPSKREFYDANGFYTDGVLAEKTSSWEFSFRGFDFSRSTRSPMNEVIGQFFARQASRHGPERGQDLEYPFSLSFEESVRGMSAQVNILRKETCGTCRGMGQKLLAESHCSACAGTGRTGRTRGHLDFTISCPQCSGTGRIMTTCAGCGGDGRLPVSESLEVEIPAGVSTGSRVRVPGKGDAGLFGGPAGDFFLVTNVSAHPFFKRFGDNIHCIVPISVTEAALGAKIEVPTIDGSAIVRIPPSAQAGQTLRLHGKGAPSLRQPGMRGDQYVEVRVVVPRVSDERSRVILRELERLNSEDLRKDLWKKT